MTRSSSESTRKKFDNGASGSFPRTSVKPSLTPLSAAVLTALSPAAVAQDEEETDLDLLQIDEVTVTATKREMSLQDIPHSIDVLSGDDMAKMGARDMDAVVKALPSMNLTATQPGRNSLVIRGISSGAFEYRTDSQVALYLDEQPMTTNSQQVGIRVIDMARVEHLPGPQGTLFGSSSQTGTIRYITNKPNHNGVSGQLEGRYGTTKGGDDSYDINGHLNLPLIDDTLALRLVGYTSLDGGYVDNVFGESFSGNYDNADLVGEDINEYTTSGGRIAFLWNMGDSWSALFGVVGENTEAKGTWETDPYLGDHKITRFHDEFREDDWYSASITLKGDLGFAELSVTATSYERDIAYEWDNHSYSQQKDRWYGGGLYYEQYYAGNPYYYNYSNYGLYDAEYIKSVLFNDQTQERETVEVRLTSSGDTRFKWMAGLYYEDVYDEWYYGTVQPDYTSTRSWATAQAYAYYYGVPNYYNGYTYNPNQVYPLPATDISYSNTLQRSVQQIAAFAELSYDITDQWTVFGGMRWSEFDRNAYSRFAFPEGLPPFADRVDGDGSFRDIGTNKDTIYKLGVNFHIDESRMVYALFSQGFRLGGINSPRAASTGQVPFVYDPDFLDNYELGIKSQWAGGRLTLNANIFFMEWSDYQQGASFDEWWLRGTINAETAETKGIEVKVDWRATQDLTLSANFFSAKPEFTADFGDGSVRDGMPMPNSPEQRAFASIFYNIPVDVFGGSAWLYYDISYTSAQWNRLFDIVNDNKNGRSPGYTYSSFSMGLDLPSDFHIDVNVRNLFDEKGYGYVSTSDNGNANLFGDPRYHDIRTLERPRTVWLTLRKSWGS